MQNSKEIDESTLPYKVPDYIISIYKALIINNEVIGVTKLFNDLIYSLGNGESLWKNIKIKKFRITYYYMAINLPLYTKKECNLFLNVPESIIKNYGTSRSNSMHSPFYVALLYSLVIANNGSRKLLDSIIHYKFVKDMFVEKIAHIKYKIIKWLCKVENEIKDTTRIQIHPIIDYLINSFKENSEYSLKGRTFNSVLKQTEIWHRQLKFEQYSNYPQNWSHTEHINDFEIEIKNKRYTITEILSADELYQEGKELNHCVLSYIEKIHTEKIENKITIWSFKENGKRLLTIEIGKYITIRGLQYTLVQARGYKNRYVNEEEVIILNKWFDQENIQ